VENKAKLDRILQEEEAIKKEKEEEVEEEAAAAPPTPKIEALDADLAKEIAFDETLHDMAPVIESKPAEGELIDLTH
jgi:hypothetical protein